jgi:hypothetical protein
MKDNIKIKKHYKNKYTTIDNQLINDMSISFKAKGVFLYFWSKPDDWELKPKAIADDWVDRQTVVYSALNELENAGYLHRKRYYINGKIAGMNYNLSDTKEFNNDLFNQETLDKENLDEVNLNKENQDEYIYIQKKEINKRKSIENKNIKKSTILSEKEILFEEFYKLYNNKTEITEKTKETKGYQKTKQRFLKETKTVKEEDVLQGTRDYLSFIAFEHKRGFNRPLKDIDTFINQNAWEGDKGIPWNELTDRNIGNEKETFINKITAPNAHEIRKQIKQQERFLLPDDNMPF